MQAAAGSPHLGLQAAVQLLQPLVSALHSPALGQLPLQAVDRHLHFQQPRLLPLPEGGAGGRQEGWAALTGRSCKRSSTGCLALPTCAAAPQTRSRQATAPTSCTASPVPLLCLPIGGLPLEEPCWLAAIPACSLALLAGFANHADHAQQRQHSGGSNHHARLPVQRHKPAMREGPATGGSCG